MAAYLTGSVIFVGAVLTGRFLYNSMPKNGSPLFKVGYALYANTRLGLLYYKKDVKKAREKHAEKGHSTVRPTVYNGLRILPIAMSLDNYCYLVVDERNNVSVLVDPSEPTAVQRVLEAEKLQPTAILTTHKHWDHSGGNRPLREVYPGIAVYGGTEERVPDVNHKLADQERLELGGLRFTVHATPGHTVGHVVYELDGSAFSAPPCLFSGDHIFLAGIGRMFECGAGTMLSSLDKILHLPGETLIWPGHEYGLDNLRFAANLEPGNPNVQEKLKWVEDMRKDNQCTVPSTLDEEKLYNPFLRAADPAVMAAVGTDQSQLSGDDLRAETLRLCRVSKDKYKYKL